MTAIVVWLLVGGRVYNAGYFPPYIVYADQASCVKVLNESKRLNGGYIDFSCVEVKIYK